MTKKLTNEEIKSQMSNDNPNQIEIRPGLVHPKIKTPEAKISQVKIKSLSKVAPAKDLELWMEVSAQITDDIKVTLGLKEELMGRNLQDAYLQIYGKILQNITTIKDI